MFSKVEDFCWGWQKIGVGAKDGMRDPRVLNSVLSDTLRIKDITSCHFEHNQSPLISGVKPEQRCTIGFQSVIPVSVN